MVLPAGVQPCVLQGSGHADFYGVKRMQLQMQRGSRVGRGSVFSSENRNLERPYMSPGCYVSSAKRKRNMLNASKPFV
jgi:hypothetical protein